MRDKERLFNSNQYQRLRWEGLKGDYSPLSQYQRLFNPQSEA
jgi:hypothetical protein